MAVLYVGLATWATVHILRHVAAEFDRTLMAVVNVGLSVLAAVGWGLWADLEGWEMAAAVGVAALVNKAASLVTTVTDVLLLRNRSH